MQIKSFLLLIEMTFTWMQAFFLRINWKKVKTRKEPKTWCKQMLKRYFVTYFATLFLVKEENASKKLPVSVH